MTISALSNPFITVATPQSQSSFSRGEGHRPALMCSCGELYYSVASAIHCLKCTNFVFGRCTHVVDIRTMEVVAGRVPSQEEYRQAAMARPKRKE